MADKLTESQRFSRNKWVYSIPGMGRDMAYSLFAIFLLTYVLFTRSVTNEQFAALGTILVIFRIWDAINDPVMGGLIENTRSKFGKFKPWIIIGAILNAVVLIIMFTNRVSGWGFVWLFAGLYLIWDITWTMNDIGYWSMLPALTSDAKRRDSVTAMANLFAGIGAIAAMGLIPMLTNGSGAIGGNSITAYSVIGIFIASFLVLSQTVVCAFVKEARAAKPESTEKMGLKKMFSVIFHNDQLLWTTLIMLLYNLGSSLIIAFGTYYMYLSFGYNGSIVTMFVAFYALSSIALNSLYPVIAKKHSRKKMSAAAVVTTVLGYLLFFVLGTLLPAINAPIAVQLAALCIEAFMIGFGQSLFYMVTTVCLTNTIEYNEYRTGSRDEALIFSLRPFMAKMGSALQQLIITVVYIAIGMTAVTNGISAAENEASMKIIDETAKNARIDELLNTADPSLSLWLRLCMTILPIILIVGAFIIMRRKYGIDEAEYEHILTELGEGRESTLTEDQK